jgi:hypothetical protein
VGRIDISIRRALTSLAFDIETQDAATHFRAQAECFGIHASSDGHITIFAG